MEWDEAIDLARGKVAKEQLEERNRRAAQSAAHKRVGTRLAEIAEFLHRVNRELARQGFPGAHEWREPKTGFFHQPKLFKSVSIALPGITASYPIGWGDSRDGDVTISMAPNEPPALGSRGESRYPSSDPQSVGDVYFWHTDDAITIDIVRQAVAEWCVRNDVRLPLR
jgi:hypothetical protein